MALAASTGQTRKLNGAGVARVALRTRPDGSVVIGFANGVALFATGGGSGMSFREHQGIRCPLRASGLELLAEGDLLSAQAFFAVNGGPAWGGVATAKKFLVDALVAGAAVAGRQVGGDHESVMINFLLIGAGLMAVEAVDALFSVGRHFVFVNDGVLKPCMTLGALSRCANKISSRLLGFHRGSRSIDEEPSENERKGDDDSQKYGTKRHADGPRGLVSVGRAGARTGNRTLETVTGQRTSPHQQGDFGTEKARILMPESISCSRCD